MKTSFPVKLLPVLLLFISCGWGSEKGERKMPDMKATYMATDKNPLGLYTAFQCIKVAYSGYTPVTNRKSFSEYFKEYTTEDYNRKGDVFCVIARQFYPNDDDVDALSDYVSNGNTLFLASNDFSHAFLEKFHLQVKGNYTSQEARMYNIPMVETGLQTKDTVTGERQTYRYFYYPMTATITRNNNSYPQQFITRTDSSQPSSVVFKYGSGRIIVSTNANAFTNYFLLTKHNYQYLEKLLAFIPDNISTITWDSYYNNLMSERDNRSFSAFQELMRQPAMRWAFWLLLLLAATWILNGVIRRQRIIDVVKPNTNTSVEFAETIGRLYLLKKDNKNIATKMITYFLEYVRSKFYISTGVLNDQFAELLATKSGRPLSETKALLQSFERVKIRDRVTDTELLELNTLLRQFMN